MRQDAIIESEQYVLEAKMKKIVLGKVVSASKQLWMKVNKKPVRVLGTDGATYPYIIKVAYTVDGTEYVKRKWISAGCMEPLVGESVKIEYDEDKPSRSRVV